MKAQLLYHPDQIVNQPLQFVSLNKPEPSHNEVLVKVHACGVCHTDLHVVEGELPHPISPIIPGHEVVGVVESVGEDLSSDSYVGLRVGVPWLYQTCGRCSFCIRGQENLCEEARFTGYTAQGGYAEYLTAPAEFVVPIPDLFTDEQAAPLLCAGVVGYRALRLTGALHDQRIGLYGFGASAHIVIQVAIAWGCEVYVFTRSDEHRQHARDLGAVWAGSVQESPPSRLDCSIIFAPSGAIIPHALEHLRPGGTLVVNAIHASPIPEMRYELLWGERTIRSVANATRQDAREFMALAAQVPIQTVIETYDLAEANTILNRLKNSEIKGAAVLTP